MRDLIRFGVSLERSLLRRFDALICQEGYRSRSEAIRDLIREILVREETQRGGEVVGTISIVYDHHQHDLQARLTHLQHHNVRLIISSLHIHLDADNCLEVILTRGKAKTIQDIYDNLKSTRGVKHATLSITTTGRKLQ
jgi:CopG family nickel-responsive transcriptional regulator